MEEKKIFWRVNSLWPFFGFRNLSKLVLGRFYSTGNNKAFTLVEVLVVIAILAIIFVLLIFLLDPFKQLKKAKDAKRKHDLLQIKNALDMYYNDHNYYPAPTSVPFGSEWIEGSVTYMKKVPQDPECATSQGYCYVYMAAASNSQWNVLFGSTSSSSSGSCPLANLSENCVPSDYTNYWACITSGMVDCPTISSSSLLESQPPTPTPCVKQYDCRESGGELRCNHVGSDNPKYCTVNCDGVCPRG